MEDVSLWRFNATVVHGDFDEEQLQVSHSSITAVKGWTDLHVGDPADDFAWLSAIDDQSFSERVFAAYVEARGNSADPHIMRRAALAAEFALAQWLVKSLDSKDTERIADADEMLQELDTNIAEYGGEPLSVVEAPRPLAAPASASVEKPEVAPKPSAPAINSSKVTQLPVEDEVETDAPPEDSTPKPPAVSAVPVEAGVQSPAAQHTDDAAAAGSTSPEDAAKADSGNNPAQDAKPSEPVPVEDTDSKEETTS